MGSGQAQLNTTKTGSIDIFSPISICLSAQLWEFRPWADGGMANLTDTELGRDSDQVAVYVAELTGELALAWARRACVPARYGTAGSANRRAAAEKGRSQTQDRSRLGHIRGA